MTMQSINTVTKAKELRPIPRQKSELWHYRTIELRGRALPRPHPLTPR
jgi:hypothetical protein